MDDATFETTKAKLDQELNTASENVGVRLGLTLYGEFRRRAAAAKRWSKVQQA